MVLFNVSSNEGRLKTLNDAYKQSGGPAVSKLRDAINSIFFDLSLSSLGKPDFPCEAVYLNDLQENFSEGPKMTKGAVYDF